MRPIPQGPNGLQMTDDRFLVSLGCYEGISGSNHFGSNPAVGTSFEFVQEQGGSHTFAAAAGVLDITSSATTDAAGQTGAITMRIDGLDANYEEISEVVTLTGQTIANSVGSFLRVNNAIVLTGGSSGFNDGDIYITQTGGSHSSGVPTDLDLVDEKIPAGFSQSESTLYTVPLGKTFFIHTVAIFMTAGKSVTFRGCARNPATGIKYVLFEGVGKDQEEIIQRASMPQVPPTWSVWAEAKVDAGSAEVSLAIDGWEVDNSLYHL